MTAPTASRPARARALAALLGLLLVAVAGEVGAEPRSFQLAIKDGRLPADQRVVQVRQGDEVTLTFTSDRPLSLHLHGYDLEEKVDPGRPAVLKFPARATGRFPVEVHGAKGAHSTLGYLEVHPR